MLRKFYFSLRKSHKKRKPKFPVKMRKPLSVSNFFRGFHNQSKHLDPYYKSFLTQLTLLHNLFYPNFSSFFIKKDSFKLDKKENVLKFEYFQRFMKLESNEKEWSESISNPFHRFSHQTSSSSSLFKWMFIVLFSVFLILRQCNGFKKIS